MRDKNVAWFLCGTIQEFWVAAVETVGLYDTHLGPISEENVVFKHSDSKRMWNLGYTIEDNFPGKTGVELLILTVLRKV